MKVTTFFNFDSKLISSTIQAHATELKTDENGTNNHWNLINGTYKGINFPVNFKQEYGKHLTDILDTGWPSLYLISDRMKEILEKNHLTGWKVFPINLYDKKNKEITGYHGFSTTGRCGPINYKKSTIIEKRLVPTGPIYKYYKGLHIELDQWDGSDFFIPEKTCAIIITQKAANVLKKNKITNIRLKNLADMEMDILLPVQRHPRGLN